MKNTIIDTSKLVFSTERHIDEILENLITLIPNDGKLYKYRSIEGEMFKNYYDALENGYLYFATADTLDDKVDTTIKYDDNEIRKTIEEIYGNNPIKFLRSKVRRIPLEDEFSKIFVYDIIANCIDKSTGKLNKSKAFAELYKNGVSSRYANEHINYVENYSRDFYKNFRYYLEYMIKQVQNTNKNMRERTFIYSMSETFNSDILWATYANNNKGFCIEYDFKKLRNMSKKCKLDLTQLNKVTYADKPLYKFDNLINLMASDMRMDEASLEELLYWKEMELMKKKEWEWQKEWRISLYMLQDHKYIADLVSAIYIDESVIESENLLMLIKLCKAKKWDVYVRKININSNEYLYEKLI